MFRFKLILVLSFMIFKMNVVPNEVPNAVLFKHRSGRNVTKVNIYENGIEEETLFPKVDSFQISQSGMFLYVDENDSCFTGNILKHDSSKQIIINKFPFSYDYALLFHNGGKILYFTSRREIFLQDTSTQQYKKIFSCKNSIICPALSHDDSKLAFYSHAQTDNDYFEYVLNVFDLESFENKIISKPSRPISISGVIQTLPVWSPDDKKIIFESYSGKSTSGYHEWGISIVNVDGTGCESFTTGAFSSDSSEVLVNDFSTSTTEKYPILQTKKMKFGKKNKMEKFTEKIPEKSYIKSLDPTDRYILFRDDFDYYIYDRTRKNVMSVNAEYDFFHHFYWLNPDLIKDFSDPEN
jgi:WD40 repeat protein